MDRFLDDEILNIAPYSLCKDEKQAFLTKMLTTLTVKHYDACVPYRRILDAKGFSVENIMDYKNIPAIPVRLFKEYELRSVPQDEVFKTMTSSGTTGQRVSRIFLDKHTAAAQTKALTRIVSAFIGNSRLPMIILDSSALFQNRDMFSARGAGVLGFSMFGRDRIYAFDENMSLNREALDTFLNKHNNENILLYGFTFMVWAYFIECLRKAGYRPDLSRGILIHGGGWKKLVDLAISPEAFKDALNEVCGIKRVYDYYGMVEQTGSIYMECEKGHLHASVFSDINIRRASDYSLAARGERGIIETVSVLPASYPGHALLTEDEGAWLGEDDCPCGRLGKYFKVYGRLPNAEIRGCGDTYAASF